jgi:hypothetical protein
LLSKENKKGSCIHQASKKGSCIHQASLWAHKISRVIKSQCFLNYRKIVHKLLCSIIAMVPHQIALMTSKVMNKHRIQNEMHCIWFPCLACMVQYILHNLSVLRNFFVQWLSIRRFSQIWL